MPRSHKPRKRYIPKRVLANALGTALDRVAVLDGDQRLCLNTPLLDAFTAFRAGRGTRDQWLTLADALNVAEAVAAQGLFREDQPDAYTAAQKVLADLSDRHAASGRWTLHGHEITTLDIAVQCHELQLDHISQGELLDAIETVKRRVRGALAGNASPNTRICAPGLLGRPA